METVDTSSAVVATYKDAKETSAVGSRPWGNKLRKKAKTLVKELDTGYMELAKLLYEVWDTPVDGDPKNSPIYTQWGYKTFAEYAEGDLSIDQRQAERLRRIYYVLNVELEGLSDDLRHRATRIGVSKAREIVGVMTLENAEKWVEAAENNSYSALTNMIRRYKEEEEIQKLRQKAKDQEAQSRAADPLASGDDDQSSNSAAPADPSLDPSVDTSVDPLDTSSEPLDPTAIPEPEVLKFKHFALYPEQFEQVECALSRAEELSSSGKMSNNLALICTDFLATNDFSSTKDAKSVELYLTKMEQLLGVRLIAFEKSEPNVVFGQDLFGELASEVDDDSAD